MVGAAGLHRRNTHLRQIIATCIIDEVESAIIEHTAKTFTSVTTNKYEILYSCPYCKHLDIMSVTFITY